MLAPKFGSVSMLGSRREEESGWLAVPLTRVEAEAAGPHRPSRGPRPSSTGLKEGKFQEWLTR